MFSFVSNIQTWKPTWSLPVPCCTQPIRWAFRRNGPSGSMLSDQMAEIPSPNSPPPPNTHTHTRTTETCSITEWICGRKSLQTCRFGWLNGLKPLPPNPSLFCSTHTHTHRAKPCTLTGWVSGSSGGDGTGCGWFGGLGWRADRSWSGNRCHSIMLGWPCSMQGHLSLLSPLGTIAACWCRDACIQSLNTTLREWILGR